MRHALLAAVLLAATAPALAQPAPVAVRETPAALPDGAGRDVTFYVCTPCHSTAVITRSGLTRTQWDELIDWMVQRQNMAAPNPELRRTIVDYLAEAFPPRRTSPRGGRNPFSD